MKLFVSVLVDFCRTRADSLRFSPTMGANGNLEAVDVEEAQLAMRLHVLPRDGFVHAFDLVNQEKWPARSALMELLRFAGSL